MHKKNNKNNNNGDTNQLTPNNSYWNVGEPDGGIA